MWWMAASCIPPSSWAVTVQDGGICWIWIAGTVFPFGSPHSRLEPWNHWWLWHFLPTDMARNISFHSMEKLSLSGWEHDLKLKLSNGARNWISICPWDCTLYWIFIVWICSTVFLLYAFFFGASPILYIHVEKIETFSISSPYSFLFSIIEENAVYVPRISRQTSYFKPQNFAEK